MSDQELATYISRAIHTLERLRDNNIVEDDDSTLSLFVRQSFDDLRYALDQLVARGVDRRQIDLGEFVR